MKRQLQFLIYRSAGEDISKFWHMRNRKTSEFTDFSRNAGIEMLK